MWNTFDAQSDEILYVTFGQVQSAMVGGGGGGGGLNRASVISSPMCLERDIKVVYCQHFRVARARTHTHTHTHTHTQMQIV